MDENFNKFKYNASLQATKTKQILWVLGNRAFWIIIIILLLELLFGALLFYKYVFLPTQQNAETISSSSEFKENFYQDIILSWEKREQNLQNYSKNEHANPF
jgi:hypothetical protein